MAVKSKLVMNDIITHNIHRKAPTSTDSDRADELLSPAVRLQPQGLGLSSNQFIHKYSEKVEKNQNNGWVG